MQPEPDGLISYNDFFLLLFTCLQDLKFHVHNLKMCDCTDNTPTVCKHDNHKTTPMSSDACGASLSLAMCRENMPNPGLFSQEWTKLYLCLIYSC